jgi:hypothetical protein
MTADRLAAERRRLFLLPDQPADLPLTEDGRCRTLFLEIVRNADWEALARLLAGIQDELQLPLPALSVNASGGYRAWFSLSDAVSASDGLAFLDGLRRRYLGDLPAGRVIAEFPQGALPELPCPDAENERWSAFIDPGMGAMFRDEPGLDIPPGRDRQADLLVGVRSLAAADFRRALNELGLPPVAAVTPTALPATARAGDAGQHPAPAQAVWQNVGTAYTQPQAFLLAVMNDPSASPEHRLRAAEILMQGAAR